MWIRSVSRGHGIIRTSLRPCTELRWSAIGGGFRVSIFETVLYGAMRFALLSPFREYTGNNTTARRIESHLQAGGDEVVHYDPLEWPDPAAFRSLCRDLFIDAAIGVHGYKSGRVLVHSEIPYSLIFSNTDLNIDIHDSDRAFVMKQAALGAQSVVTYTEEFKARIKALWPACKSVRCIPKGVVVDPEPFDIRAHLRLPARSEIIILPATLRPVKDPLYVIPPFIELVKEHPSLYLAVFGARRQDEYATWFQERIRSVPSVRYGGTIPPGELHTAMLQSIAVVNSSQHEQEPNAVLEALALGKPVIARRIPGIESIITHRRTGLLFEPPQAFLEQAKALLNDSSLRESLEAEGKAFVGAHRSIDAERRAYQLLAAELVVPKG